MIGVKDDTGFRKLLTNRTVRFSRVRFFPVACLVFTICLLSALFAVPACAQSPGASGSSAVPLKDRTEQNLGKVSNRAYTDKLDQPVISINVEGNVTIPESAILRKVMTQIDRNPSQKMLREDIQRLYQTRWFFSVSTKLQRTDKGLILTFVVKERPIVDKIEYRGNDKLKDKVLAEITGLRAGSPYDVSANQESVQRLQNYYKEKGYFFAKVKLISGDQPEQRDVIFEIVEGKKTRVQKVYFEGNEFVVDGVLKTHLSTKRAILWKFGGLYDPSSIQNDLNALTQYYTNYGYFDVGIDHRIEFNEDKSAVYLHYTIKEGKRYKIRNRIIRGNEVFNEEELAEEMELGASEFFNARILGDDIRKLKAKYGEQGRFFAKVEASPVFLETPGEADLLYNIDEDIIYTIRNIDVRILGDYPHTKETVALNRMVIQPGDKANPRMIKLAESRLGGSQIFERSGASAPKITVHAVTPADGGILNPQLFRGQSGEKNFIYDENSRPNQAAPAQPTQQQDQSYYQRRPQPNNYQQPTAIELDATQREIARFNNSSFQTTSFETVDNRMVSNTNTKSAVADFGHSGIPATVSQQVLHPGQFVNMDERFASTNNGNPERNVGLERQVDMLFRGQSPDNPFPPVVDPNVEESQFTNPYNPIYGGNPQGDPLGGPPPTGQLDIRADLTEARTGRFMFGVGVNSDSGVAGNIVLEEQNFDLWRPPTSFQDIINGTAWRGAGQKFRLEAVPGSEIGRYTASWSDPYFMDTEYSFGVSAFYFTRFYPDWDEQRTGGRFTLGKQLTPEWTVSGSFRLEDIEIDDPSIPTPQELTDALGSSLLTTVKGAVTHDTRDAPFMPGEGHIIEANYEQAFGDYSYPKVGLEASQYFTVFNRPDGGGRHIISLAGQLGWTGSDTPIFEQFFAGGFQTFRGFSFRGVGPVTDGVNTGGEFLALGSVEYIFPLMANETVQAVAFSDFGTVEDDVAFDAFRMSIGGGLRVTVPAMGPVPLAFDWAYPIIQEDFDDKRIFSFYVGFTR
ncbi:Outer membrane protein assembly factor BamA precursor [Polystyrenella longa]|uniref:Outer membrane protein assembly factor BamA n=1 Tax=Polystyrenella longa TaxID=2528007 RepID=A0A518CK44_9PLAN|nr:POTRA domain-containing protein [Polystyrenella longa]QDU79590.1 Outer membrane protein assembly factor BamA precursor [Polystyrenella longa]